MPPCSIILRSYNEAWALQHTLPALLTQEHKDWELIVIDSGSTDGSQALIQQAKPAHFVQIQPSEYNPGRVLNHGARLAQHPTLIFLNADATPQNAQWLAPLVLALQHPKSGAVYSRQIPRPDCQAVFAADYDRCFGPQRSAATWDHFFSLVSSGIHRRILDQHPFREDIQYAEDDELTRWAKGQGYDIHYAPDSIVAHSHNYTPQQAHKRAHGDALALGTTWAKGASTRRFSFPRLVLLGLLRDLYRDTLFTLRTGRTAELPHALRIRWNQRLGKYTGLQTGLRQNRA